MAALPFIEGESSANFLAYGTGMKEDYRVRRVDFGDGFSQRAEDGINNARQVWQMQWKRIRDADAETLRLFFRGLAGVATVDWTPYAQATPRKWTATGWQSQPNGAGLQDCSITFTEEFDL